MILNQNVIRNNVLKNILIEEIIKAYSKIKRIPQIECSLCLIQQQILIHQNSLQEATRTLFIRQFQKYTLKEALKKELIEKIHSKIKLQQSTEVDLKQLQKNHLLARQTQQKLNSVKSHQKKLKNQLQQVKVYQKQFEEQATELKVAITSDKKTENSAIQAFKQLCPLTEAKKSQLLKQQEALKIIKDSILQKEKSITDLKLSINKTQASIASLQSTFCKFQNQKALLQHQFILLDQRLEKIQKKTLQYCSFNDINRKQMNKNNDKSTLISSKTTKLIEASNQINSNVIQTRKHLINLNVSKNNQKKINQELKNKVRKLMKIVITSKDYLLN